MKLIQRLAAIGLLLTLCLGQNCSPPSETLSATEEGLVQLSGAESQQGEADPQQVPTCNADGP